MGCSPCARDVLTRLPMTPDARHRSRLDDGIDCGLPAGMTTPWNNGITECASTACGSGSSRSSCGVRLACTLVSTRRLRDSHFDRQDRSQADQLPVTGRSASVTIVRFMAVKLRLRSGRWRPKPTSAPWSSGHSSRLFDVSLGATMSLSVQVLSEYSWVGLEAKIENHPGRGPSGSSFLCSSAPRARRRCPPIRRR